MQKLSMTRRPLAPIPQAPIRQQPNSILKIYQRLADDPMIVSFEMRVNKRSDSLEVNARHQNGQITHYEEPVPGLKTNSRFNPNNITSDQRDDAVMLLLNEGMSQVDVGRRLGISQSRVSQIARSNR